MVNGKSEERMRREGWGGGGSRVAEAAVGESAADAARLKSLTHCAQR